MDYQKVIELLKKANRSNDMVCILPKSDISKVIISAMQELQELYSIGTAEELRESMQELQIYKENEKRNLSRMDRLMDECSYRHENGNCLRVGGFCTSVPLSHCQRYKDWYKEYMGYRKLGTLEEVREAVEKQKAKRPTYDGDGYAPDGTFVWDEWKCPCCGTRYEVDYEEHAYCPYCGKHIDWSEEE
jgi:hypothetical protein